MTERHIDIILRTQRDLDEKQFKHIEVPEAMLNNLLDQINFYQKQGMKTTEVMIHPVGVEAGIIVKDIWVDLKDIIQRKL